MEVIDSLSNRLLDALAAYTTIFEVIKIIKQFSKSKPPEDDGIPAKIYKYRSKVLIKKLCEFISSIWDNGIVP